VLLGFVASHTAVKSIALGACVLEGHFPTAERD